MRPPKPRSHKRKQRARKPTVSDTLRENETPTLSLALSGFHLLPLTPFASKLPTFTRLPSAEQTDVIVMPFRPGQRRLFWRQRNLLSFVITCALRKSNSPALKWHKQCVVLSEQIRQNRRARSKFFKSGQYLIA